MSSRRYGYTAFVCSTKSLAGLIRVGVVCTDRQVRLLLLGVVADHLVAHALGDAPAVTRQCVRLLRRALPWSIDAISIARHLPFTSSSLYWWERGHRSYRLESKGPQPVRYDLILSARGRAPRPMCFHAAVMTWRLAWRRSWVVPAIEHLYVYGRFSGASPFMPTSS
jgi:hypothetical protein